MHAPLGLSTLVALLALSAVPVIANTGAQQNQQPTKTCRRKRPWRSDHSKDKPSGGGGGGGANPSPTFVPVAAEGKSTTWVYASSGSASAPKQSPPANANANASPKPSAGEPKSKTQAQAIASPPVSETKVPAADKPTDVPPADGAKDKPKTDVALSPSPKLEPAPAPASAPANNGKFSGKAGVTWAVQEKDAGPIKQFFTDGSAVKWWYDWNKNAGTGIFPNGGGDDIPGAEFIPMLFDHTFLDNGAPLAKGWTHIMVFNEPGGFLSVVNAVSRGPELTLTDLNDGAVSTAMSPSQAATEWKTVVDTLRKTNPDAKFISPGLAFDINWLQQFFQAICPGESAKNSWGSCKYKPDLLNVHAYSKDVDGLKSTVGKYHDQFNLPIILSEFACHVFPSGDYAGFTATLAQVDAFMTDAMKWLDSTDYIVKYAWFGAATNADYLHGVGEANRLLDAGGKLTALGKKYMNGGK